MLRLIIKTPGYFLSVPGVKPKLRSPLSVDISKSNIDMVIKYLNQEGVSDYNIVSNYEDIDYNIKKNNTTVVSKKENPSIKETTIIKESLETKKLENQMKDIQNLLKKMIDKNQDNISSTSISDNTNNRIQQKNKDDDLDNFIPKIDLSNMDIRPSKTKVIKKSDDSDIDLISDLLRSNLEK